MCSISDDLPQGLTLDHTRWKTFFFFFLHYHTIFGCWPVQILASVRTHFFVVWQPPEIPAEEEEGAGRGMSGKGRAGGPWGMWLPSLVLVQEEE